MRKKVVFTFGIITLLLFSCSKYEEKELLEMSCESVPCTYELRTITAKVVDQQGKPATLDRIKVTRLSNGQELIYKHAATDMHLYHRYGYYPIVSDLHEQVLPRFREIPVRFQGYIGSKEVVNAVYVVAFDCCHISLVSGERELIVQ